MVLTPEQAHCRLVAHLGDDRKVRHSRLVAHLMRGLGRQLRQDVDLWEVVGLCHDIDDLETRDTRHRHGLLAAEWLKDDLPEEALDAIRSHDHRTGFLSDALLADGLKLADALAIADEAAGRAVLLQFAQKGGADLVAAQLVKRPYLMPIIERLSNRLGLDAQTLVQLLEGAPIHQDHTDAICG